MKIPLQKLKAILLYFCENTEPKYLGKVKLMKLFYFLDFLHVKQFATPVTYDRYTKMDHGPIPSTIKNMIDDVDLGSKTSDLLDTIDVETSIFRAMHQIVPKRKITDAERKLFSENELQVLKEVCTRFGKSSTKEIEDASHGEAPWKMASMYQEIPYTMATNDPDCRVEKEDIELGLKIAGL